MMSSRGAGIGECMGGSHVAGGVGGAAGAHENGGIRAVGEAGGTQGGGDAVRVRGEREARGARGGGGGVRDAGNGLESGQNGVLDPHHDQFSDGSGKYICA